MRVGSKIDQWIRRHGVLSAVFEDKSNKAMFFTAAKILFDLAHLVVQVVALALSPSVWYATLAALYLIYLLSKLFLVLSRVRRGTGADSQYRAFRNTGIMLILTTLPFAGSFVLIYTMDMSFSYSGLLVYANAAWAFFRIITAIVKLVEDRREDCYLRSVRGINAAGALVAIATLQVAMLHAYWPEAALSPFNAITGGAVTVLILAMGVRMIVLGTKGLRTPS